MLIHKDNIKLPKDFPFSLSSNDILIPINAKKAYHWHECLEISFVRSGHGYYFVWDKKYEMNPGDIIIFNNVEPHAWNAYPPAMVQMTIIFNPSLIWAGDTDLFDYQYLKPFVDRGTNFDNKLDRNHPASERIQKLLIDMESEYLNRKPGYRLMIKAILMQIMTLLIRFFQDSKKSTESIKSRERKLTRLETVLKYINKNYSKQIELTDVAKIACMNPNYFSTFFKQATGLNFVEYRDRLRITHAINLIKDSNRTIADIAMASGFNSLSAFYKCFGKITGKQPLSYKQISNKGIGDYAKTYWEDKKGHTGL